MFQSGIEGTAGDFTASFREILAGQTGERRSERRRRVLKGGRARYHNGLIAREALVRDVTEDGLRIKLADAHLLPGEFDFMFAQEVTARPVRRVWVSGDEAGLAYR